jgi:hypothetical protein
MGNIYMPRKLKGVKKNRTKRGGGILEWIPNWFSGNTQQPVDVNAAAAAKKAQDDAAAVAAAKRAQDDAAAAAAAKRAEEEAAAAAAAKNAEGITQGGGKKSRKNRGKKSKKSQKRKYYK